MDLNAVRLFAAAAHAGSLSEAARRTGVPLPTLSRRVRKLEDELGIRLLERGPTGLGITSAGTQLLSDVDNALATLEQAERRLHDATGIAGVLRASIPPDFPQLWDLFSRFRRRYPSVRLDVFISARRIDLVADGVDVAIRIGEGGSPTYVGRTLVRYRHRLVAAPAFLEHTPIRAIEDLAAAPLACWRMSRPPTWSLGEHTVRLEPVLATNEYSHLLAAVLAGGVVTELPHPLAFTHLAEGTLVEVLPDHPFPELRLRALVVEKRALSPLVRGFLDFAAAELPSLMMGHQVSPGLDDVVRPIGSSPAEAR